MLFNIQNEKNQILQFFWFKYWSFYKLIAYDFHLKFYAANNRVTDFLKVKMGGNFRILCHKKLKIWIKNKHFLWRNRNEQCFRYFFLIIAYLQIIYLRIKFIKEGLLKHSWILRRFKHALILLHLHQANPKPSSHVLRF